MFAIVKTGGKQYKVAQNYTINVEKIEANEGDKITLDSVLFIDDENGDAIFGEPFVKGATVEAEVLRNYRDKKVIVFKKKKKTKFS
jgi:large subunit ribosomal protein L21